MNLVIDLGSHKILSQVDHVSKCKCKTMKNSRRCLKRIQLILSMALTFGFNIQGIDS